MTFGSGACVLTRGVRGDFSATMCMKNPIVLNNELLARPFPHHKTGYKDPRNNCNRTDRRNGGEFSMYESLYQASHAHVSNMPVKFRQDGIPISARRVDGMPLMSPKLPSRADLMAGRALSKKYSTTKIQLGNPHVKDPKHYKTVSKLMYPKYKRTTYAETNPGIAAEESRRSHHRVWG